MAPDLDRRVVDAIGWLLLVVLTTAPLLLGGHMPLAWGINATLIGAAIATFAATRIAARRPLPVPHAWLGGTFIAFFAVVIWIYLQSVSWTPALMHHDAWASMGRVLDRDYRGAISINPSETRLTLLRLVTAGAVFWLALQLGRDPRWAYRVLYAIAISATAYALYGIFVEAYSLKSILWREKPSVGSGVVTATFVSPNSFAIYAVLGLIAALGLLVRTLRATQFNATGLTASRAVAAKVYHTTRTILAFSALVAPLVMAIVLSGSRAGLFFLIAIACTIPFLRRITSRRRSKSRALAQSQTIVLAAGFGLGLSAAVLMYGSFVVSSLQRLEAGEYALWQFFSERRAVWWISISALMDAPWTGFGYGTFSDMFPAYRDSSVSMYGQWMKAHNAYVEAMVGLGIPMTLVLFYAISVPVYRVFAGALTRRRDQIVPLVAAAACPAVGIHQLIDFSIYMQGVALVFAAILGVGTAQSWSSQKKSMASASQQQSEFAEIEGGARPLKPGS